MSINVKCPACGRDYSILDSSLGKVVRCPVCRNPNTVGDTGVAAPATGTAPANAGEGQAVLPEAMTHLDRFRRLCSFLAAAWILIGSLLLLQGGLEAVTVLSQPPSVKGAWRVVVWLPTAFGVPFGALQLHAGVRTRKFDLAAVRAGRSVGLGAAAVLWLFSCLLGFAVGANPAPSTVIALMMYGALLIGSVVAVMVAGTAVACGDRLLAVGIPPDTDPGHLELSVREGRRL